MRFKLYISVAPIIPTYATIWFFIYKAISYSPAFAVPSAFVVFTSLFGMGRGDILQL